MTDRHPRLTIAALALWGLVAVLAAFIATFAILRKPKEEVPAPPEKAVPVRLAVVELRGLSDVLVLPGRVEAGADVVLSTEIPGRVTAIAADRGARVKAGQSLLKLDARTWEAQQQQMEIESREAEKEFTRWQELQKSGGVSASDFDRIRKTRELAAVGLEHARVQVSRSEVRSPVDGVVDDRSIEVGEYAAEGRAVLRVVDTDTVKVIVDLPEREAPRVQAGLAVPFRATALPGAVFTGTVAHVALAGGRESNTFRTELRAANPGRALRPGMIVEAEFNRGARAGAIVVPMTAVIPRRGEHMVFVADGNRAASRFLRLDAILGQEAVVGSGLKPGERLVVEGQRALQDGALLDIRDSDR